MQTSKTVFLRLHQPQRFGDVLSLPLPMTVDGEGGSAAVELDHAGRLTVSVVHPWMIEDRRAGYLHLLSRGDDLLARLKEVLGVELAFLPDDTLIPAERGAVVQATMATLPAGLMADIRRSAGSDRELFTTSTGRQRFLAGFFPLLDGRENRLGDVAVLKDVSGDARARLGFSLVEAAIVALSGGLLFALFWGFISRMEQRLVKAHADLENEVGERRRTEASLGETNQVLEDIAQGITESILLLSRDFRILWANRHALEETGHELQDIVGSSCYKITHHLDEPCQPPDDICPLHELLETGQPCREEHVHYDKDDNKIFVAVTAYPIRDAEGNITKFVHVSKDISERKRAEEERERLVAELRRAVSEVQTLSGMLPICASCKKIRDDQGYWNQIESYIKAHSQAEFSHGICPDCFEKLYPEYCDDDMPEADGQDGPGMQANEDGG